MPTRGRNHAGQAISAAMSGRDCLPRLRWSLVDAGNTRTRRALPDGERFTGARERSPRRLLAASLHPAELDQFRLQPMPQWAFRPQFVEQRFGLAENLVVNHFGVEQLPPASRDLLFGKQTSPLSTKLGQVSCPIPGRGPKATTVARQTPAAASVVTSSSTEGNTNSPLPSRTLVNVAACQFTAAPASFFPPK